jgi:hypothetical protein
VLFLFHQLCLRGSRTRLNTAHHKALKMYADFDFAQAANAGSNLPLPLIREPESGLNLCRHLATIRDARAESAAAESQL